MKYKILQDYPIPEDDKDKFARIEITEGKYKGLIYHYIKVGFEEQDKDGKGGVLKFSYDVDKSPEGINVDLLSESDKIYFDNLLGDNLVHIIENKKKDPDADRTTDISQPSQ